MGRADPHVVEAAAADVPEHILLRATRRDAQIKRAAVGVHAGRLRGLDPARRQSVKLSNHISLRPSVAIILAHIGAADTGRRGQTRQDGCRKKAPLLQGYLRRWQIWADSSRRYFLRPLIRPPLASPRGIILTHNIHPSLTWRGPFHNAWQADRPLATSFAGAVWPQSNSA